MHFFSTADWLVIIIYLLGIIGLGRMGAGLVLRLMRDGHVCVGYDVDAETVKQLEKEGATGAGSIAEFCAALSKPRAAYSSSTPVVPVTVSLPVEMVAKLLEGPSSCAGVKSRLTFCEPMTTLE